MMYKLIEAFPNHLKEAVNIANDQIVANDKHHYQNIVISGMGGSGIGGKIARQLASLECKIPLYLSNGYDIPAFVNKKTLFIASSYSGGTEETVTCTKKAIAKNATIIAITTGGELADLAKKHHFGHIKIPGGNPPRASLGYSITQLLGILEKKNLVESKYLEKISNIASVLVQDVDFIQEKAKTIAKTILNKNVIIYAPDIYEPIAVRFRQQLNENSKVLCWHHVLPEMNHNEIVGWETGIKDAAVLYFKDTDYNTRINDRWNITKSIIEDSIQSDSFISEIKVEGDLMVDRFFYMIHLLDWVSYYLGELRKVDLMEIKNIDRLKAELEA